MLRLYDRNLSGLQIEIRFVSITTHTNHLIAPGVKNHTSSIWEIMEWNQLQSNIARCRSAMNAFLWALDKLNFPLGKEHVFWLKLLPPENFDKFVLQSKTKSFELQQFQGQQHFNMITADLLLMHPWWQVGFLLHFGFFFLYMDHLFYTRFIPLPIKQANTVMTIFGFTSTRSSGRA